jgi:hypothetical protein
LENAAEAVADPVQERTLLGPLKRYAFEDYKPLFNLFSIDLEDVKDATSDGGYTVNIGDYTPHTDELYDVPEPLSTLEGDEYSGVFTHLEEPHIVLRDGEPETFSSLAQVVELATQFKRLNKYKGFDFDVIASVRDGRKEYQIQYNEQDMNPKPMALLVTEPGMIEAYHSGQDVVLSVLEGSTMAEVMANYPDAFPSLPDGASLLRPVEVIHARIGTS